MVLGAGGSHAPSWITAWVIAWVGGANVPTAYMRANGSFPFGVFELSDRAVRVRLRPAWFGAIPLVAAAADLKAVYPVRGMWSRGIGLRLKDGREWYFWTFDSRAALDALERRGFPVSWETRRATRVWQPQP